MGYRTYIGEISKSNYDKIKNLSKNQILEFKNEPEDGYVGLYDLIDNHIYELGKYVDEFGEKEYKDFFLNKETQEYYTSENHCYIVSKKFMELLIEMYTKIVKEYYSKLLKPIKEHGKEDVNLTDAKKTGPLYVHIKGMASEWGAGFISSMKPYDLKTGPEVSTSWKYEYAVFEMVRIYKNFDWENKIMVYYGY